jgi:hypothetical protein
MNFKIGETIKHKQVGTVGKVVANQRMCLNGKLVDGIKVWIESENDFKFLPNFNFSQFETI